MLDEPLPPPYTHTQGNEIWHWPGGWSCEQGVKLLTDHHATFALLLPLGVLFQSDGQCPHSGCRGRWGHRGWLWLWWFSHSFGEFKGHWSITSNWPFCCKCTPYSFTISWGTPHASLLPWLDWLSTIQPKLLWRARGDICSHQTRDLWSEEETGDKSECTDIHVASSKLSSKKRFCFKYVCSSSLWFLS